MRNRPFNALGTNLSELALGTWGLSGDGYGLVSPREAAAVIDRAVQLGITLFETCDAYGRGEMEKLLGERLASFPGKPTVVVTRVGTDRSKDKAVKRFDRDYLRQAVEASSHRLGRTPLDVVLLHNPRAWVLEEGEAPRTMQELKEQGKVKAWGVSAGSTEAALAALDAGAEVLSLTYNVLHTTELAAVASDAAMRGTTVLAHSILAYGLLTCQWGPDRWFDDDDHRRDRWDAELLKKRISQLDIVRDMVGGDVLTPRAAALRFVLSNSLVASAVIGPKSTAQLEQLVREAGSGPPYLSERVLRDLPNQRLAVGIHD